jgi:hypothetical protein
VKLRWRTAAGPALLVSGFMALSVVVSPFHNTPVQDDWDYARTVQILLRSGSFQRSEIAQATELFSALWGAAFAWLLGFSFDALRLSTLVLSAGSLVVFYGLLGELGFSGARRTAGVAALLFCPLFVFLSFSFMTDVPALACLLAALYFYVRALNRRNARLAVAGSVCATLAFLTRQIGLVSALAAASYILVGAAGRQKAGAGGLPVHDPWRVRWIAASAALPAAVALVYTVWTIQSGGVTWANTQLTLGGTLNFVRDPQTPATLTRRLVVDCMTVAVYLLPLWLLVLPALHGLRAAPRPGRLLLLGGTLAAALFVVTVARLAQRGEYLPYLTDAVTRQGLRPYLAYFGYAAGAFRPDILPLPLWEGLTVAGCVLGWGLPVLALRRFARTGTEGTVAGTALVYWTALCLAVPTLLFPEFYERFLLPFLPAAIILLLDATRRAAVAPRLAAAGVVVMAVCSIALMKDYWGWMDVRWPVAQSVISAGVPLQKLDGGYEWDGWNLYEQSMDTIRQKHLPMQITPWAYVIDPQYMLAFAPVVGYHVAREVRFESPFGAAAGHFYVLERD